MKKYLQLGRLHTAPLETVPAIVGAGLATGSVSNIFAFIWAVYGFVYHIAGYSHNSCVDYKSGEDRNDPHKQHHPLNTGELDYTTAMRYVTLLMAGLAVYCTTAIFYFQSGYTAVILVCLVVVQILFGVGYNVLNTATDFKFILITISHSLVFIIPYFASGGSIDSVFAYMTVFMVFWITFQISVSGEIKDITVDAYNFMHRLGTRVEELDSIDDVKLNTSKRAMLWAIVIHDIMALAMLLIVVENIQTNPVLMGLALITLFVMVIHGMRIVHRGRYNRDKRVSSMAIVELSALSIFVLLSSVYIDPIIVVLIPISIAWVVIFNNIQWGTTLGPDV